MSPWQFLERGDGVSIAVALVLLAMSVASWVVILWKSWLLQRVSADLQRSLAAFWQAPALAQARLQIQAFDRHGVLLNLIDATAHPSAGTLASTADASQQLTRSLRDALNRGLGRLQLGQVLLATVGATAPFVGLLGTVWGIYHALLSIAGSAQISLDKVAGPVGESLVMTAAGLVVAIPAVLAYNVLGRVIGRIEADLEGFAHDLRELLGGSAPRNTGTE